MTESQKETIKDIYCTLERYKQEVKRLRKSKFVLDCPDLIVSLWHMYDGMAINLSKLEKEFYFVNPEKNDSKKRAVEFQTKTFEWLQKHPIKDSSANG